MNYITVIRVGERDCYSKNYNSTFIHIDYYLVNYGKCIYCLQPNVQRIQDAIISCCFTMLLLTQYFTLLLIQVFHLLQLVQSLRLIRWRSHTYDKNLIRFSCFNHI